jgi:hypothetical protein
MRKYMKKKCFAGLAIGFLLIAMIAMMQMADVLPADQDEYARGNMNKGTTANFMMDPALVNDMPPEIWETKIDNVDSTEVPEPSTMILMGTVLVGFAVTRKKLTK